MWFYDDDDVWGVDVMHVLIGMLSALTADDFVCRGGGGGVLRGGHE